jgi:hypothetical protein
MEVEAALAVVVVGGQLVCLGDGQVAGGPRAVGWRRFGYSW